MLQGTIFVTTGLIFYVDSEAYDGRDNVMCPRSDSHIFPGSKKDTFQRIENLILCRWCTLQKSTYPLEL